MSEKQYVDINAVVDYSGISKQTTRKWVLAGHIPKDTYIKVGDTYRYNIEAMEKAFLERNEDADVD